MARELLRINQYLEQRVEEKIREARRNLNTLRVSQEILEELPVAVIGIGEEGIIIIANQMAYQLFSVGGTRPLLGVAANGIIPAEMLIRISSEESHKLKNKSPSITSELEVNYWYSSMRKHLLSDGIVLVVDPDLYEKQAFILKIDPFRDETKDACHI